MELISLLPMLSLPIIFFFIVFLIGCAIAYPYVFRNGDQPKLSVTKIMTINLIIIVIYTIGALCYSMGAEVVLAALYFVVCLLIAIASRRWIWLVGGVIGLIPGILTWLLLINNIGGGRI
ncbi:hypothetical protein H7F33_17980 [Pedobacter sp. PAMC26386]|nr:hypothetical protein H7F33_17980 [Pedobacter sp. PAMC26386]